MKRKPVSPYCWRSDWVDTGVRCFRLRVRETNEIIGYVKRGEVGGALAFAAIELDGKEERHVGWYPSPADAKRALVAYIEIENIVRAANAQEECNGQ